jgi:excisionase family DNA binding protein
MRTRSFNASMRIMTEEKSETVLTKRDIARELQLGRRTIDVWMRRGKIPYLKIGKTVRFRMRDVLEKLQTFRVN